MKKFTIGLVVVMVILVLGTFACKGKKAEPVIKTDTVVESLIYKGTITKIVIHELPGDVSKRYAVAYGVATNMGANIVVTTNGIDIEALKKGDNIYFHLIEMVGTTMFGHYVPKNVAESIIQSGKVKLVN